MQVTMIEKPFQPALSALLLFLLTFLLAAAPVAPVHAQDLLETAAKSERIAQGIKSRLDELNQSDFSAKSPKELAELRAQLEKLRSEALSEQSTLQSPLSQARARLNELGEAPKENETEPEAIAAQRAQLNQLIERLTTAEKQFSLFAVEADQISSRIADRQKSDFLGRILQKSNSIIDPRLWFNGLATVPEFYSRVALLIRNWIDQPGGSFWFIVLTLGSAMCLIAALWIGWRQQAARHHATNENFRRLWRAFRLPLYAFIILALTGFVLEITTDLQPRHERITTALFRSLAFTVISLTVLRGILRPANANMRLVDLDTASAAHAFRLGCLAILIIAAGRIINEAALSVFLSNDFAVLLNASVAISLAILMALFLLVVRRADPCQPDDAGTADRAYYFGWTRYFYHICWIVLIFSALALLSSYVALASYFMTRVISSGLLVAALLLLHHMVDSLVSSALDETSTVGQFLRNTMSLGDKATSFLGLTLSSIADIGIVLLGLPLIMAQWTLTWINLNSWIVTAFFGFKVGDITISPSSILLGIFVLLLGLLLARLVTVWLEMRVLSRTSMDAGVRNSVKTGTYYAGVLTAGGIALTSAGLDFSNLAIVAGALGVGIGFGLQSIVNNFVSGLILLAERPIKVGDWISVSGGEGIVKRINVRSTEIETFDRCSVIVPNSNLISEPVNNWYHNDVTGRVRLPIGVAYDSDPEQVEKILLDCAYSTDRVVAFPSPFVLFMNFGASSLDFELRAYIDDVAYVGIVGSALRFKIFKAFKEAGIEIPFPQQDLYIKTMPREKAEKPARKQPARKQSSQEKPA